VEELVDQQPAVGPVRRARIRLGQPEQRLPERLLRREQRERLLDVEPQPIAPCRQGPGYRSRPIDLARRRTRVP
jgi:hypothetical protein